MEEVNGFYTKKDYFIIDNFDVNFFKLREFKENYDLVRNPVHISTEIKGMEDKLISLCEYLIKRGIPFESIEISAKPSLVIDSFIYQEIMRNFVESIHSGIRRDGFWNASATINYLKDLKIEETMGATTLNFKFNPIYNSESSYNYFLVNEPDGFNFHTTVGIDQFIKKLEDNGYELQYNDKVIHDYNDYFIKYINSGENWEWAYKRLDKLLIKIPFSNDNKK